MASPRAQQLRRHGGVVGSKGGSVVRAPEPAAAAPGPVSTAHTGGDVARSLAPVSPIAMPHARTTPTRPPASRSTDANASAGSPSNGARFSLRHLQRGQAGSGARVMPSPAPRSAATALRSPLVAPAKAKSPASATLPPRAGRVLRPQHQQRSQQPALRPVPPRQRQHQQQHRQQRAGDTTLPMPPAGQRGDGSSRPVSRRMRACIDAYARAPEQRAPSPESVWEVVPAQGSMRFARELHRGASGRSAGGRSLLQSLPSMRSVDGGGSVASVRVPGLETRFSFNAPQPVGRRRARSPTGSVASIAQSLVAATRLPRSNSRASSGILPGNGSFTREAIQRSMQDLIQEHKRTGQRMGARRVRQEPLKIRRTAADVNRQHKLLFDHMQDPDMWSTLTNTKYSRRELIQLFIRFKALCQLSPSPHGIDLDTFRRGTPALSVEDDYFTERVFTVLDKDCSGYITFKEYLQGLHVLQRGTRNELLRFLFAVHDENLDGAVSKQELFRFFLASLRVSVNENIEQMSVNFVDSVFGMLDKDNNGVIKLEDAQAYLDAHPSQTDVFGLFGRTMSWGNDAAGVAGIVPPLPPIDSGFAAASIDVEEERAIVRRMNFALTHKARHRVAMSERRAQNGGGGPTSGAASRATSAGSYASSRGAGARAGSGAFKGNRRYLARSPAHRRRANSVQERVSEVLKATVVNSGNGSDSNSDDGGDAYGATLHVSKAEIGATALKTMMLLGTESEGRQTAGDLLRAH